MAVPTRVSWAIGQLGPMPSHRLLEIGCGRGIAMELIAATLTNGHITGLDRSASAAQAAVERNRGAIEAGKAAVVQCSFAEYSAADGSFDEIFAINVNLFWLEAARELALIRRLLAPEGRLSLFFEPPAASQIGAIRHAVGVRLRTAGYQVDQVVSGPTPSPPLLGITARLAA